MTKINAKIDYKSLSEIATEELEDQPLEVNSFQFTLTSLKIWKDQSHLKVNSQLKSKWPIQSHISFIPIFDQKNQKIIAEEIHIDLKTNNYIFKSLVGIFKKQIKQQIKIFTEQSIFIITRYVLKKIYKELDDIHLPYELEMNLVISDIKIEHLSFEREGIDAIIHLTPVIDIQ